MLNSVTNEGFDKINTVVGKSHLVDFNVDTGTLLQLFNRWCKISARFGILAVYHIGRIDGIRQERARKGQKSTLQK